MPVGEVVLKVLWARLVGLWLGGCEARSLYRYLDDKLKA